MRTRLQKLIDNATAAAAIEIEQLLQNCGAAWMEVSVNEGTAKKPAEAIVRLVTFADKSADIRFILGDGIISNADGPVHENGTVARVLDLNLSVQDILGNMQLDVEELRLPWKK